MPENAYPPFQLNFRIYYPKVKFYRISQIKDSILEFFYPKVKFYRNSQIKEDYGGFPCTQMHVKVQALDE